MYHWTETLFVQCNNTGHAKRVARNATVSAALAATTRFAGKSPDRVELSLRSAGALALARCLHNAVPVSIETPQHRVDLHREARSSGEPIVLRLGIATQRSGSGPHLSVLPIPSSIQGRGELDTGA